MGPASAFYGVRFLAAEPDAPFCGLSSKGHFDLHGVRDWVSDGAGYLGDFGEKEEKLKTHSEPSPSSADDVTA